ncbi:MAG: radical SAM protein [Chloroflexi bacterium]|nr:radical SAM protein [Chloroflexota bacterium]
MDKEKLRQWLIPHRAKQTQAIAPGLYHYMQDHDGLYTRFHLRVEPDGRGMLLANASAAARLSPTGALMAKGLLDKQPEDEIVKSIKSRFKGATPEIIQADLQQVKGIINRLVMPEDDYPILNLDELNPTVFESELFAPLEATVSLAPPEQIVPLLNRLWEIGIPHITFFVPEKFDPVHLVRSVERAEDLGMIAGVRGRATDLSHASLLADLAQAGVDHVTVLVVAGGTADHDTLCGRDDHEAVIALINDAYAQEVYPVAEIALIEGSVSSLQETLNNLIQIGITTFSFFAIVAPDGMSDEERDAALTAQAMPQTADWVEEISNQLDVRFIWQPPVRRNPHQTLAEQVQQGPRSAGDAAVRIEADGRVIPPRGPYQAAGNILSDDWQTIWDRDPFTRYRERVAEPTRCVDCPGLVICMADCPREPSGWASFR